MIRQKRGLFTFIFSLLPGAGEMYMGFFKQGISIMLGFFGIMAVASITGLSPLAILVPVVWFYSFFHVHNLASMPPEEFSKVEDHILFVNDDEQLNKIFQSKKTQKVFAIILIIVGVFSLWDMFTDVLYSIVPYGVGDFVYSIARAVPRCLIAVLLIYVGVVLIKGKKKELDNAEPVKSEVVADAVIIERTAEKSDAGADKAVGSDSMKEQAVAEPDKVKEVTEESSAEEK